jgi:hypothetical protein
MAKIPVGRTIASAYTFLFGQIGPIIATAGGPAVLYAGADYVSRAYLASARAAGGVDANQAGVAAAGLGAALVALFAVSVAGVAVTRIALGQKTLKPQDFFPLDRTTLRMFAANLRFVIGALILVLIALAITFAAFLLAGVPLNAPQQAQPTLASAAAAIVAWAAFIYVAIALLRMGFLLPAVVVSEEKAGLKRSHDLSEGNTGRLFAVALALIFPLLVLGLIAASAVLSAALGPDFPGSEVTPEILARVENAIAERLLTWEIFNAVMFVLYAGLMYAGAAFAYRAAAGQRPASERR